MLSTTDEKKIAVKCRYFHVSDDGIQLVKNGIASTTIGYDSIRKVVIKWGIEVENWFMLLVTGLLIFGLGCYLSSGILSWVIKGEYAGSYKVLFMLLTPICGLYFVYSSLKVGPVMIMAYGEGRSKKLPIKEVMDRKQFDQMLGILSASLGVRLHVLLDKS